MFVSHETVLEVGFAEAAAGLAALAHGGWLRDASGQAYTDGLAGLARVGPFGDLVGASKLVEVRLLEPVPRDSTVVMPLRWEATGVMGRLFPVLDANLTLTREGDTRTRLTFTGAYRPPLAALGAGADRIVLRRAASATVRSLVRQLAGRIGAAGAAPPADGGRPARAPHGDPQLQAPS
jgi:hypothetical protein